MMDLWAFQPINVFREAVVEGFRGFTWKSSYAFKFKTNPIARFRAMCMGLGDDRVRFMLLDGGGAAEFDMFCPIARPLAVYPVWDYRQDPRDMLVDLCEWNVGERKQFYADRDIHPGSRPVAGQKHRIVVTGLDGLTGYKGRESMEYVRYMQLRYPKTELFVTGLKDFDKLFGWDLKAGDFTSPGFRNITIPDRILLPSGKCLENVEVVTNKRYSDWFDLLGISQAELVDNLYNGDRKLWVQFNYRAARWARENYGSIEPFVVDRYPCRRKPLSPHLMAASSKEFVLPAARRRTMRNLGLDFGSFDKLLCDTCILHNTCTLYRKGAVCAVKGTEGMTLAENFGSRNADSIISGLSALARRQAERVEDGLAREAATGNLDPEVTKAMDKLFANGVKLAKLIDPTLSGGPKVNINVGVGAGGQAAIVASQDPRQITTSIVAEIEAAGVPRDKITGDMIRAYLEKMGTGSEKQAVRNQKAIEDTKRALPDDYPPEDQIIDGEFS